MDSVDFGLSFSYVFRDKDWIKKVLIGGLFVLLIPAFFIGAFILLGYTVEIIRRVATGSDSPLPEWDDIGGYLTRGFVAFVGVLIWYIPLIIFSCCVGLTFGSGDFGGVSLFGNGVNWIVSIAYGAVIPPVVLGRYALGHQFNSMFEFNEIFAAIQRIGAGFVMVFLITLVASFIGFAGIVVCFIGLLFTYAYYTMVAAHAYGQVARIGYGDQLADTADQVAF